MKRSLALFVVLAVAARVLAASQLAEAQRSAASPRPAPQLGSTKKAVVKVFGKAKARTGRKGALTLKYPKLGLTVDLISSLGLRSFSASLSSRPEQA